MSLKVYKASAGSGKTFKLALEYITLALITDNPKAFTHILAVTFTNKATAEMKERILTQLYKLANNIPDRDFQSQLMATTGQTAETLRERAGRVLETIVHDFDHFRVETIDSFFQSMLSNLAYDLGLARNFRVSLDTNEAIARSVERMLLAAGVKQRSLARLTKTILDYMQEQIDADEGWMISKDLQKFAQMNLFAEEYLQHEKEIEAALQDEASLRKAKNSLTKLRNEAKQELVELARQALQVLQNLPVGSTPRTFTGYGKLLLWVQALIDGKCHIGLDDVVDSKGLKDALEGEPLRMLSSKKVHSPENLAYAEQLIAAMNTLERERKQKAPALLTFQLILKSWTPLMLLSTIGKGVTDLCDETGTFMLAKTTDLFNKMVNKEDASFIFERAGITFHHVLIDEFQDTSRQQWGIFKELLLENMANNEECMIVGDVKQSIYRWRSGDWKILKDIADERKRVNRADVIEMKDNYRSDRVIVNFNNTFFTAMREALDEKNTVEKYDDQHLIKQIYEDVEQIPHKEKEQGFVRLAFTKEKSMTNEVMNDLYRQIVRLHEDFHVGYNEMMIIVRKNSEGADLVNYFSTNFPDIPVSSNEAFFLDASTSVNLIIAAMRYLTIDEELLKGKGQKQAFNQTCVAEVYCRQTLLWLWGDTPEAKLRTEQMMQTLHEKKQQWSNLPLYELCKQLMRLFELPKAEKGGEADGIGQSAYLFSFLDYVLEYLNEHASDVPAFLDYWDQTLHKKQVMMNEGDAIQILTVHKSKGLEKHTVFVPFCNWAMEKVYDDDNLWCVTKGLPEPLNALPAYPINSHTKNGIQESVFAANYNAEILMKRIDAFNELYVAFTRPRHNLFVWSFQPGKDSKKSIYPLIKEFMNPGSLLNEEEKPKQTRKKKGEPEEPEAVEEVWEEKLFGNSPVEGDRPAHQEEDAATEVYRPETPFDTEHTPKLEIHLQRIAQLADFQQSNRAKEFIAEKMAEVQAETDPDFDELLQSEIQAKQQKQQEYIDEGKLIHKLFSYIRTADDIETAGKRLWNEACISDPKKLTRLCNLVRKRITQPNIAPWFTPDWQVFAECSLLLPQPDGSFRELRPDRVMTREGETVVIDYKFGAFRPEHEEQVRAYMRVLTQMNYPNVRGYLFYGYKGQVCEVVQG